MDERSYICAVLIQYQAPDEQQLCLRALDTATAALVPTALYAQTWSQSINLITTSVQIKVSTDINRSWKLISSLRSSLILIAILVLLRCHSISYRHHYNLLVPGGALAQLSTTPCLSHLLRTQYLFQATKNQQKRKVSSLSSHFLGWFCRLLIQLRSFPRTDSSQILLVVMACSCRTVHVACTPPELGDTWVPTDAAVCHFQWRQLHLCRVLLLLCLSLLKHAWS